MSNVTKEKRNKNNLPPGNIEIGQAKRGSTLELIHPQKKELSSKDDDEESSGSSILRAEFSFSSEYPVLRYDWWEDERFYEVLSHDPAHPDTSRIQEGVCPLLWNHKRDEQRGIILSAKFADGRATCVAEYDDDEEGRNLYRKVMAGTRRGVSFLYQVKNEYEQLDMQSSAAFLSKYGISDPAAYAPVRIAKSWEIFEISNVSIPADPTVGIGKSYSEDSSESPVVVYVKNYTSLKEDMATNKKASTAPTVAEEVIEPTQEEKSVESRQEEAKGVVVTTEATEPTTPQTISLTAEQIRDFVAQAVAPTQERATLLESENHKLATEVEALRAAKTEAEQRADIAQTNADVFRDISKLIGRPEAAPMINTITNPVNNNPHGAAKEFIELFNSPSVKPNNVRHENVMATQRDIRPLQRYIHQQFAEARQQGISWQRSHFVRDLEAYFKSEGFLSGRAAGPTLGTAGSIGSIYLDTLSAMMRETHNANNIWWQFPTTVYDSSSAPNKTVLIPRANNLPAPTDIADFFIADPATYNSINYVRGLSTDSQSLDITTVPITIAQWGLGLSTKVDNRPVFIPEFIEETSLVNLMSILDSKLMQHYFAFEDLFIRSQYERATTLLYNKKGEVATLASTVQAGDEGTCTEQFLNAVYTYMYAARIPTLANNQYILCLPPIALKQLKNDFKKNNTAYALPTEDAMQQVSAALLAATGIEIGRSSGYVGSYCGFEIFSGNTWGVGGAGVSPTVNSVTFGAGASVCEDAFVFTGGAVGRGVALPVEIRASGTTPFQMGESYIWLSREQVGAVDLDSTISAGQQTRVLKLRFSRTTL